MTVMTHQAVLLLNWTTVTEEPRPQVDLHDVSAGGAAEDELIVL